MVKTDIGGFVDSYELAVATHSYTPQSDRAGRIVRMSLTNASANDTWRLTIGGREMLVFRHLTVGNQRLFLVPDETNRWHPNLMDWDDNNLDNLITFPVPWGLTATLKSDGGATADISFLVQEVDPSDISPMEVNHYRSNVWVGPIQLAINTAVAAAGVIPFDTQFAPGWVPSLLGSATGPVSLPVGWTVELIAMFLEGGGVNTFSGAANHQSVTKDNQFVLDGELLYTHAASDGIANQGNPSAAGSANTVFGQRHSKYPPFEAAGQAGQAKLYPTLKLVGSHNFNPKMEITGDVTGGASYATFLQTFVARVTRPDMS